jgi:signal transduction histidine kinase
MLCCNCPDLNLQVGHPYRYGVRMRLTTFIINNMETILAEWEAFASTLFPAAADMSTSALRDHAQQILEAVARDLTTSQTREAQSEKSRGRALKIEGAPETAAQTHAVLRARSGFDINQLVAEYRALRASVLRLWMDFSPLDEADIDDMMRFNEAIDQAVAESVGHFHHTVEQYRNLLLGMLGHDLRNPLSAIVMTARSLANFHAGQEVSRAAGLLIRSGKAMQELLDDLTDFNRTNLGLGMKIVSSEVDLANTVADELEQFRAAYPHRRIEFASGGDTRGRWDGARVQQLLRNLVSNAIRHGSDDTPVRVTLHGDPREVRLEVSNDGQIDPSELRQLFDPLRRGTAEQASFESREGLGLGLFIVREIARAHGGEVEAYCEAEETTFAVRLPRREAGAGS